MIYGHKRKSRSICKSRKEDKGVERERVIDSDDSTTVVLKYL